MTTPLSAAQYLEKEYGISPLHSNGASGDEFHRTDVGNAKRLVALHGDDLRYCFPKNAWVGWDDVRWVG